MLFAGTLNCVFGSRRYRVSIPIRLGNKIGCRHLCRGHWCFFLPRRANVARVANIRCNHRPRYRIRCRATRAWSGRKMAPIFLRINPKNFAILRNSRFSRLFSFHRIISGDPVLAFWSDTITAFRRLQCLAFVSVLRGNRSAARISLVVN